MNLSENPSLYDLLEITPDASSQEVRAAYLRAKSAYKKDSVALYTLMGHEETEELLAKIEQAYQILSTPERRKEYDASHGFLNPEDDFSIQSRPSRTHQKIVSIDRVPPMEATTDTQILVPPATDFRGMESSAVRETYYPPAPQSAEPIIHDQPQAAVTPPPRRSGRPSLDPAIEDAILHEVEWSGAFLRRVREARRISIEEMSEFTRISKTYLSAVEDENYSKLPAAVYMRGFVTQFAKFLKLPAEKVVPAYMARYTQSAEAKAR